MNTISQDRIKEDDIIKIYDMLGISTNISVDIEEISERYKDNMAKIERDTFSTFAFAQSKQERDGL